MKKATVVLIAVLIAVMLAGCGSNSSRDTSAVPTTAPAAKPKPVIAGTTDLKETAGKVVKLIEAKDWANLYNYLYPDIQNAISKEDFVALKKDEAANSKIQYKNYKVGEPKLVGQWVDNIDNKTYQNAAEIPYTVDVVTPRGEISINNSFHLAQTADKKWCYLWINKN